MGIVQDGMRINSEINRHKNTEFQRQSVAILRNENTSEEPIHILILVLWHCDWL
jgi:hypothetical protein